MNKVGKSIRTEDVIERMNKDTEDVDLSTSTYTHFNLSNKEENNTSYANEPKLKQSSILSKQKQDNITLNTTENKEGIEERYEKINEYVVGNEVDNKVVRNFGMEN